MAGTVEEIGLDVPAGARTVGERVGGFVPRNSSVVSQVTLLFR